MARIDHSLLSPDVSQAIERLGDRVARARKRRGLKQAALANQAGVSRYALSRLERGNPAVSLVTLGGILAALGLLDALAEVGRIDPEGMEMADATLRKRIS